MRERDCKDLPEYVGKFHHVVTQVRKMSELDQIMYLLRGLTGLTRQEVQFCCCTALSEAITVALDFEFFTALIHRDIPRETRTIDRGVDDTKTVADIDRTKFQRQWT